MIIYRAGNAALPPERPVCIVHCTNDISKWGAGFTAALDVAWPEARASFLRGGPMVLGEVRVARLTPPATPEVWIAHCCGQRGVRSRHNPKPLQLAYLKLALRRLARVNLPVGTTFHLPRIGCGLAGGLWEEVEPVVAAALAGRQSFVYTFTPPEP